MYLIFDYYLEKLNNFVYNILKLWYMYEYVIIFFLVLYYLMVYLLYCKLS